MAVVKNWGRDVKVQSQERDGLLGSIARDAWKWFEDHRDERVLRVGIWPIRKTIRIRHFEPVWERVFGSKPEGL